MLLVIGNILTSQLTCYDAIHLSLVKKKGGGFETHVTFSMELFVTIVHSFWVVLLSKRATWLMGQGSWTHFLKNILFRLKLSHKWKMITVYISNNIKGMLNYWMEWNINGILFLQEPHSTTSVEKTNSVDLFFIHTVLLTLMVYWLRSLCYIFVITFFVLYVLIVNLLTNADNDNQCKYTWVWIYSS